MEMYIIYRIDYTTIEEGDKCISKKLGIILMFTTQHRRMLAVQAYTTIEEGDKCTIKTFVTKNC